MPHALRIGTSYFETATAVALDQFSKAGVDVEILEAGVGARLDATTAVAADIALITPIGLDHQNWLGDTLQQITEEKGYATSGCDISISAPQQSKVAEQLAAFCTGLQFCEPGSWPELVAAGEHQKTNASLAYSAIRALLQHKLITCDLAKARAAISSCQIPGRLQKIKIGCATIWLDAAHNRHAVEALTPSLHQLSNRFDAILVFTREDRSLDECLPLLTPFTETVVTRSEHSDPVAALNNQIAISPQGSFLVLGSFITVAEILRGQQQNLPL